MTFEQAMINAKSLIDQVGTTAAVSGATISVFNYTDRSYRADYDDSWSVTLELNIDLELAPK
jgi:hypothetical protein